VPASTCYLAIVPWFYLLARLIDMLRSRGHHQAKSFWVPRREVELDESYFNRMGRSEKKRSAI
jgi:hypothetical protein